MNLIQPIPLYLNNRFLTGVRPSVQSTPRSGSTPQADLMSNFFDQPFMGGGFSEILNAILQRFGFGTQSPSSFRTFGIPQSPPVPPDSTGSTGSIGSVPLKPAGSVNPPPAAAAQATQDDDSQAGAAKPPGSSAVDDADGDTGGPAGATAPRPAGQPAAGPAAGNPSSIPSPSGHEKLDRWDAQIRAAAESTGLPANYIKATMWAESRGVPEVETVNGGNGHTDKGLMQISDHTYGLVMESQPNAPRGLKASNPNDNIMMGAWELKDKKEKAEAKARAAGQTKTEEEILFETSKAYVGTGDAHEAEYATWVQGFKKDLDEGRKLVD